MYVLKDPDPSQGWDGETETGLLGIGTMEPTADAHIQVSEDPLLTTRKLKKSPEW